MFRLRDGSLHATQAACPHAGGPLADGQTDVDVLVCPLHLYAYRWSDGASTSGAAPIRVLPGARAGRLPRRRRLTGPSGGKRAGFRAESPEAGQRSAGGRGRASARPAGRTARAPRPARGTGWRARAAPGCRTRPPRRRRARSRAARAAAGSGRTARRATRSRRAPSARCRRPRQRGGNTSCRPAARPPARDSGTSVMPSCSDRAAVHPGVGRCRGVDQVVERDAVGPGQRQQQFQRGPAPAGLQPRQRAHRDAGGPRRPRRGSRSRSVRSARSRGPTVSQDVVIGGMRPSLPYRQR